MLSWNSLKSALQLVQGLILSLGLLSMQHVCADDDLSMAALRILEKRCLSCHNDVDQKGDVAFSTSEAMQDTGLIDTSDPAASHLLTVVSSQDGDPPAMPKDSDPLTADDQDVLRNWISAGAVWPDGYQLREPVNDNFDWWSFRSLQRPDVPEPPTDSPEAAWIQTPIDAFIAAKHREHGVTHATEADRLTLVRRIYYDLTGLPPTPEEVADFVESDDPNAWDHLIDRLLESDRYGERWARHWLDVVKYADTCGYDKDKLRPNAWPYRDYVVESFNADKPYARFIQEQLAGDVLFPGDPDGIRALGFIAAGPWDFIGHAEVSEDKIDGKVARNLDRDDMVANTLNTFCSVTIQCARCHNHKFDPFTQEHYYSLQSIFAAVDKADRVFDVSPEVERQRKSLTDQLTAAKAALDAHQTYVTESGGQELAEVLQQIEALQDGRREKSRPVEYGYHSHIASKSDASKWVEVDLGQSVVIKEVRLRACSDDFGGIGAGFGFPVRFRVDVSDKPIDDATATTLLDFETEDAPNPHLAAFSIPASDAPVRYIRVTATQLAVRSNDYNLALAELEAIDASGKNLALNAAVSALDSIEAPVRWQKTNLTDGRFPEAQDPAKAQLLAEAEAEKASLLGDLKTSDWLERRTEFTQQIASISKQLKDLPAGQLVYAAATDFKPMSNFKPTMGKPRTVRLLHRGNVTQPKEEVTPGVIPLNATTGWHLPLENDHSEADRRAALAQWLVNPENPLTWRSVVNRIWQYHFGQPIVKSPNDFGRMGQPPTHPELLDWLACEFRDNGQSFKHLHRLILKSAVWKQASIHHPGNAEIDGSNQFLWKHARRRLSAEELRDSVLMVSGRLNLKMGGPGYYLFALEKTDHSPHYEYHKFDPADEASHRRSIYRFIVRSQPDPFMTTMDCADSSQSTPRRTETFTALQALSLMNNNFTIVMAQAFRERLQSTSATSTEAVDMAFTLCTGRPPTAAERLALTEYADTHGLAAFARVMFNLNEFIFID